MLKSTKKKPMCGKEEKLFSLLELGSYSIKSKKLYSKPAQIIMFCLSSDTTETPKGG